MTNFVKGESELVLEDGRAFTLVMDFEALVTAESLYRQPVPVVAVDAAMGFVGAKRALLYGAMRAKHPEVTPADALEMCMTDGDRVKLALEAADKAAYPDASEDKKRGKAASRPRGKNSGASGARQASNRTRSGAQPRARSR